MTDATSPTYTVIGGYLGAGKTTLLNYLLTHNRGRRLAVLVNDFGDINIDAALITRHDGETIQLANGCICCSLADGFVRALGNLRARGAELDSVVIEASGVADPVKIAQYGAVFNFALDAVVVVVDAEQIRERAANKYVGDTVIRQLQSASVLVVNKADLVSGAELASLRDWLRGIVGDVPIIETSYGQVDPVLLSGEVHLDRLLARIANAGPQDAAATATGLGAQAGLPAEASLPAEAGPPAHGSMYESVSFISETPLDEDRFNRWAASLPPEIIRAKGVVFFDSNPEQPHIFQRAAPHWTVLPAGGNSLLRLLQPTDADLSGPTRIVLIGLPGSLDAAQVRAALLGEE